MMRFSTHSHRIMQLLCNAMCEREADRALEMTNETITPPQS